MSRLRPPEMSRPARRQLRASFPYVFTGSEPKGRRGDRCRGLRGARVPVCVWIEFMRGPFVIARRHLRRAEP